MTAIKACTGCLRHPRADCGATRRPASDYPAAAGDLQELASVTVCARQPRRGALPPSRHTHSQAHAGRLFLAGLRTADGQWECPVIGADRAPAVPKIATEPDARAGSCKTRSVAQRPPGVSLDRRAIAKRISYRSIASGHPNFQFLHLDFTSAAWAILAHSAAPSSERVCGAPFLMLNNQH